MSGRDSPWKPRGYKPRRASSATAVTKLVASFPKLRGSISISLRA